MNHVAIRLLDDGRSASCGLARHAACPAHTDPTHPCKCPCHDEERRDAR